MSRLANSQNELSGFTQLAGRKWGFLSAFAVLIVVAYLIYMPGLTGPYLMDDTVNLSTLGAGGEGIRDLDSMLSVVFGNLSGPLGRPVSMVSFLLDSRDWPVPASEFKHTNLLIHLLCGIFVGWFTLLLFKVVGMPDVRARVLALFVSAIWLLHPLNVSTTLYVVQRMTQLMALFSLMALVCYLHGMTVLRSNELKGVMWLCLSLFPFGLLAVLSKENGALLVVAILVLQLTVFSRVSGGRLFKLWLSLGVLLPLALIILYVGFNFGNLTSGYQFHDFSLPQRLLTEARILCESIVSVFVPVITDFTLFHDDIELSTGLFSPLTTVFSLVVLAILFVIGVLSRQREPVLAFGILWFFGWHLLESTFIPLELYFEHRNYLPMLGLLVAAVYYAALGLDRIEQAGSRRLIQGFTAIIPVACAILTLQLTLLWGDIVRLQRVWAEQHPASYRAQTEYAYTLSTRGRSAEGMLHLRTLERQHPDEVVVLLQAWNYACRNEIPEPYPLQSILHKNELQYRKGDISIAVRDLVTNLLEERCELPGQADVLGLMERLERLPMRNYERGAFHLMYADFYIYYRQLDPALIELRKSFESRPDSSVLIRQATLVATAGLFEQSLVFLQRAREADQNRAAFTPSRADEIDEMEQDIKARLDNN